MNNGYGKFCQDPTRYKEHYITDPNDKPPADWWSSVYELGYPACEEYLQPIFENDRYWLWCKPAPGFRYNNVGTGASITGAARAVLLEALQNVSHPIYCDTDSIICKSWNERQLKIDKAQLGAWDLEDEYSRVIIAGKKLYAVKRWDGSFTVKSKGTAGLNWEEMLSILDGHVVPKTNRAPTLTKYGDQKYLLRAIKATAEKQQENLWQPPF